MNTISLSVVIPTFNRKESVLRAIDSIFGQNGEFSISVIVVDDGSTDGTYEALNERFGNSIMVIRTKNNGVSSARNIGMRMATTEWVAFLDSDDYWLPSKLVSQFSAISEFKVEFVCCATTYSPYVSNACFITDIDIIKKNIIATSSVIFNKKFIEKNGFYFDEKLNYAEDLDLWLRCLSLKRGYYISRPFVHYQVDANLNHRYWVIVRDLVKVFLRHLKFYLGSKIGLHKKIYIVFIVITSLTRSFGSILFRILRG